MKKFKILSAILIALLSLFLLAQNAYALDPVTLGAANNYTNGQVSTLNSNGTTLNNSNDSTLSSSVSNLSNCVPISVLNYGVKTSNTAAANTTDLNSAITANEGNTAVSLYFPPGDYLFNNLSDITGSINLQGVPGKSIIDFSTIPTTQTSIPMTFNATNVYSSTSDPLYTGTTVPMGSMYCQTSAITGLTPGVWCKLYDSKANYYNSANEGELVQIQGTTGSSSPYTVYFVNPTVGGPYAQATYSGALAPLTTVPNIVLNGLTFNGPGACVTGYCNTSGSTATWETYGAGGQSPFNTSGLTGLAGSAWTGSINIGGSNYTISGTPTATSLSTTTSLGSQSNAQFYYYFGQSLSGGDYNCPQCGVEMWGAINPNIINCQFNDWSQEALCLQDCENPHVSESLFYNIFQDGFGYSIIDGNSTANLLVDGCKFTGVGRVGVASGTATGTNINGGWVENLTVTNSYIENENYDGVNTHSPDIGTETVTNNDFVNCYKAIEIDSQVNKAIANNNNVLNCSIGYFNEYSGNDGSQTVNSNIFDTTPYGVEIGQGSININDNMFNNSGIVLTSGGNYQLSNITINSNTFKNCTSEECIQTSTSSSNTAEYINIDDNTISNCSVSTVADLDYITGLSFLGNTITNSAHYVKFQNDANVTISGNTMQYIYFNTSTTIQMVGNVITSAPSYNGSNTYVSNRGYDLTFSGTGSTTTFTITTNLSAAPTYYVVTALNQVSAATSWLTLSGNNIVINFATAPASGTNNIAFNWYATSITATAPF